MESAEGNKVSAARKLAGTKIGELIDEIFATRKAFCDVSGISPKKLSDVVHGRKRIDAELAEIFAKLLNKDKEFFFNLEKDFDAERNIGDPLNVFLLDEKVPRMVVRSPDGTIYYIPLETPLDQKAALDFARSISNGGA